MGVLKSVNAGRGGTVPRAGIALDLGDLRREAERIEGDARARAAAIIAEARVERERIVAGAAEEGWARGHAEGLVEGREAGRGEGCAAAMEEMKASLESLARGWDGALRELIDRREHMLSDARRDLVALAAEIARRVVKRSIELDPSLVVDQVRAALDLVMRRTRLALSVHPADRELVERALPELAKRLSDGAHVELIGDDTLARGSCVLRTEHGEIDGGIDAQLDRMVEALLGRPSPGGSARPEGGRR